MPDILLIFSKNPRLGRVKTRLAASLGPERALAVYHALLDRTRAVTVAVAARRMVFYSDFIDRTDAWEDPAFEKHLQAGRDLGERMARAIETAFAQQAEKAVIIGCDCPGITPELLSESFRLLDRHDYVLGPALDGGYYLLGLRAPAPWLFEGIAWSTDTVARVTLDRMQEKRASVFLLPVLRDVDTEADLRAVWPDYTL